MKATSDVREAEDGARQVVARAAAVLRTLERDPAGLTIAGIARSSGLPRTTVTRLVGSLQAERFVAVADGVVRLGPALLRLAASTRIDAAALARPHMEALAADLGETVDLWVERDGEAALVAEIPSEHEVRIAAPPGFRLPLATSAPGKAFLAGLSDAAAAQRVAGRLEARTPRSLAALDALLADLAQTRRRGYALDEEEHAEDVSAIACLVDLGLPERHALAVPAPARRFRARRPQLAEGLLACARAIEAGRGQAPPEPSRR